MGSKGYTVEDYLAAYEKTGSYRGAARLLGLQESTVRQRIKARKLDASTRDAMQATNAQIAPVGYWVKTKSEDGTSYSAYYRPQEDPVDFAREIAEALEGMQPADPIEPPAQVMDDLCTVYPLMDVHLGMRAWAKETGSVDYDTGLASADMRRAFAKVCALTPASHTAVLIVGGDFYHMDDNRSETPAHRHKLDTDSRYYRTVSTGVELVAQIVENLAKRHKAVIVRVLRGNHDEHSHVALSIGLSQRYRLSDHVTVEEATRDIFMMQWGRCMIASHHGDKAPPERLTLYLSDVCPYWSSTRHRYCFTGHVHKDQARDVGPLRWESLRAFAPPDAYAAGMGYAGRRALQSITFDKISGLVLRAMDPVERG